MPDLFVKPTDNTTLINDSIPAPKKENHFHSLASFCQNPSAIGFQTQEQDETILLFLRRHFVTNIPWIITTIFFLILPFILNIVFTITNFSLSFLPPGFIIVFIAFYYLIVFAYGFVSFFTWYYNISFITNKRVVDIDFKDVVYKNIAATKLSQVEDVSFSQVGVIRSVFDYGDVLIQTAATIDNFDLLAVPKPEKVVQIVEALIGRKRNEP